MNIIFGNLAGDFNNYFIPGGGVSESRFKSSINRNAYAFSLVGPFVSADAHLKLVYCLPLYRQVRAHLCWHGLFPSGETPRFPANLWHSSASEPLAFVFQLPCASATWKPYSTSLSEN